MTTNDALYWKSKAITLEYENKMLINHIRNMYKSSINYYNQNHFEETDTIEDNSVEEPECVFEEDVICEITKPIISNQKNTDQQDFAKINCKKNRITNRGHLKEEGDEEFCKQPMQISLIDRQQHAEKLYGTDWKKIVGMETAVQLHYDLFIQKSKANFWPVIPMKIVFSDQDNPQSSDLKNK